MTEAAGRSSAFPIDPMFLERWSPRAFADDKIGETELLAIIEAARWAPSSSNVQPWRFMYALRGSRAWETFLGLLVPANQSWAKSASALLYVASNTLVGEPDAPKPSFSHSFDAGSAWMSFALQAHRSGWHTHGMAGFDKAEAPKALGVPDTYRIEAAIAIGRIGDKASLPEGLQAREQPSDRKPLSSIAMEGGFKA